MPLRRSAGLRCDGGRTIANGCSRLRIHLRFVRGDQHPGSNALHSVHYDQFARIHALADHAQAVHDRPELHFAIIEFVVFTDDQDELSRLIGSHRAIVDENRGSLAAAAHLQACNVECGLRALNLCLRVAVGVLTFLEFPLGDGAVLE